ncbi:TonB-dependent receptor [Alteromonas sp. KUL49]|uniref:TonB-dependent receptor domain-containing protein n=1 Tax=Alteromonas sp. KUL49 TaxID=2480798 RepID=UPI00102F0A94|nr:TonB-dependent receptor [Alteromonas sp. KUL49]TAP39769.1 TonB-dependent receptor [Alteromonas sp. KUL49]GEA11768.1 TonB-dependent receptor [Alteromonas sp. KUL49]
MFTNSKLAKSVKLACAFGAASAAMIAPNAAFAQEAEMDAVEKIEVTGSRIKRTDLEGASPVVSITAADIKLEGDFTVADALRSSSLNSFGSFSERSGSSAQSQATINLRGAGSRRTLVLLNGRRFPGSPTLGGAAANLNAIPMAAVERIDIMTEGASSIYGSDAMAGVVNIVLREDYEGLTFNIGAGQRTQDEGTTSSEFSVVGGLSNDKGNITFAFDHQKREGISDADRDYTKAQIGDLDGDGDIEAYTADTVGWSYFGATVLSPDFATAQASLLCDDLISEYGENTFRRVDANEDWGPGSEYCMFAYANVSYNTASIDRNTLYVSADYEVAEDVEWFGQAMVTQNSSFGRYAPPAAAWTNMAADNPHNPYGVDGAYGLFRWVGIGTRDGNVDDYNQDYTTGLRGIMDWNDAEWEVYYHFNMADNKSVGQYYLSYSGLAYNEANGIDLGSEEGIANMKATTLQESSSKFHQYFAGMGFDMFELSGGYAAHYFGVEFFEQTYADIYDGQSEAGRIGGSAGNSSSGERDVLAVFFESALPVTEDVELNVKARYDDYSDFGSKLSPAFSARWDVMDGVVIRGSYSESFRAPGLDLLNAARTFSAEGAIDFNNGATTSRQYDTYYTANPDLEAETSDYTNLGIAWDVNDNLNLKLDYFSLSIDNVIQAKSLQNLLSDEAAGLISAVSIDTDTSDEVFYLKRSASGTLVEAGTSYFNGAGFEIEGIDFTIAGSLETGFGDFRFQSVSSFVLSYDSEVGGVVQDVAGWSGSPDFKSVATAVWSYEEHSLSWNITYTDSTSEFETDANGTGYYVQTGKLDSWLIHNVTYTYDMADYGNVTFTVNNLLDEDPVLSSSNTWDNADLYNNFGRDIRVNYQVSF